MANCKEQSVGESDVPYRRRGRPAGRNRVPLSREERRARNAQYERERRNETAEVMSQLAEAANCDPNISNADLLATVISRIQRSNATEGIADLKRINANLEAQIATLESRLRFDVASHKSCTDNNNDSDITAPDLNFETSDSNNHENFHPKKQRKKRKHSEQTSLELKQDKRTKTQSGTWSVDSGIEVSSITPPATSQQDCMQFVLDNEKPQPLEKITEEQDHVVPYCSYLQSELYQRLYNSDSQSSAESELDSGTESIQSTPCMKCLARSLFEIPSIIQPPNKEQYTQPETASLPIIELPDNYNEEIECVFLPQTDAKPLTLDLFTDSEKKLVAEFLITDGMQ